MNESLTIVLLGQAGVGKSFVGNNLYHYLKYNQILDPNLQGEQKFQESFAPKALVSKEQVISEEVWFVEGQKAVNIVETIPIGQIEGMSRNQSCKYIINQIRNKYENIKYVLVFHQEKQLDGENLKDFYDYLDALQKYRQDVIVFLNKRNLKKQGIEEYILNSYIKQQQYFEYLALSMSGLCPKLFNKQKVSQHQSEAVEKILIPQQENNVQQQHISQCSQEKSNLTTQKSQQVLFLYSEEILSKNLIIQLTNHNVLVETQENQLEPQHEVNLILFNLQSLLGIFKDKQKQFLYSLKEQRFSKNIILYFNRKKQISPEIENIIMQNNWKLLKEESLDSIVSWIEKTPQKANLNEILSFLNNFI